MEVKVIGVYEINKALKEIIENIEDPEAIPIALDRLMKKFVHVASGYLRKTVYYKAWEAGADAGYAGYEEERGGSHAYATMSIEEFSMDDYADKVVKPF